MKKIVVATVVIILCVFAVLASQNSRKVHLPSSKTLTTPVPGYIARTNSFPATIAVSPDHHYAALLNQGYGTQESQARQSIAILDLGNNQLRDFPDDRLSDSYSTHQSYFIGLAFSSDGKHLYASIGSITDPAGDNPRNTGNGIAIYKFESGQVTPERFVKIAPQKVAAGKEVAYGLRKAPAGTAPPYPAGFAVLPGDKGDQLLIANNLSDNVVLLDINSGQVLKAFDLSRKKYVPSAYPYTVIANKAGTKAWCSLWNEYDIAELNLESGKVERWIPVVGAWGRPKDGISPSFHPTAMVVDSKEQTLYVTLSNADIVAAIDLPHGKPFEYYSAPDVISQGVGIMRGTVPQALALSADEKRMYVAAGALDAVELFDLTTQEEVRRVELKVQRVIPPDVISGPVGFIPTEWYPSALAMVGNDLLIATAKGQGSGPNNMMGKLKEEKRHRDHPYIPTLIGGSISRLSLADIDKNLPAYTKQVQEDNLMTSDPGKLTFAGGKNPIKHVIYILKENRTYDQVLGDLPVGDGDPSLTMYGAEITPNLHKIALEFGVVDNFYDSGEVSGDGHIWSNAATTTDYNEKNWPIAYRSKERTYDADGTVADEIPLEHDIPDVDDPGTGFLWDNLAQHNLTYRIYGEFIHGVWCRDEARKTPPEGTPAIASSNCPKAAINKGDKLPENVGNPPGSPSPWPWAIPMLKQTRPTKAALRDHFDPLFPDFNTDYPDQLRADEFLREFAEFVKARGTGRELPQYILLYLPDDHTGGTRPNKPTPQASVADNDLAVGRVVEAVSHSPYWDDTAIFIIEDDAQDGADHVDAHRSTAYVVSKYAPHSGKFFVDHRFYTTVSMVHTMEALLGLPPMNLFDSTAPLMAPLFAGPGDHPPFQVDDKNLRSGLIYKVNQKTAPGAKESSRMDFSRPDAANAHELNAILWRDAKGDMPMPAPTHTIP